MRVTIPYSKELAEKIPALPVRLRRDFKAILNLIRSHALVHRGSRERDAQGRIVATLEDYAVVRELVVDLVSEGVGMTVPDVVRETAAAVRKILAESDEESTTIKKVGEELKLDYSATHRRVGMALDGNYLKNLEDRKGKPARLVMGDPLPENRQILPTVVELRDYGLPDYDAMVRDRMRQLEEDLG